MAELAVGFSPCPNDTFMFHALVHGLVEVDGLRFTPHLADIEALNVRAHGSDPLPVTKLSVPALASALERYAVLDSGAALGHGSGPIVVCRAGSPLRGLSDLGAGHRVAVPGRWTTARFLYGWFADPAASCVDMRFQRVMPAVASGDFDAGVVIHEGRFTYPERGLRLLADLGALWEQETGGPLPLGVIAVRRDLGNAVARRIGDGLRASIELARRAPRHSDAWVRAHSQELDADVCARHIALYVNDYSVELGESGRRAIDDMLARGRARGLLPHGGTPWLA